MGQRNAMRALSFCPASRDSPNRFCDVDLGPCRLKGFGRTTGCEGHKPQGKRRSATLVRAMILRIRRPPAMRDTQTTLVVATDFCDSWGRYMVGGGNGTGA